MKQGIRRFFRYARARHQIYLDRQAGKPRPWTADPILNAYRFTNVFRELDKTTVWFREHVRDPLRDRPEVLLATVVFRLLNRIETGRAVFCDDDLLDESSAFFEFARTGRTAAMRRAILARCGKGPYVTGAYIISSPKGMKKLDGVLEVIQRFYNQSKNASFPPEQRGAEINWKDVGKYLSRDPSAGGKNFIKPAHRLQEMFDWLKQFDYLGKFHSYEIVTDLRHTALLDRAPDINSWCNVGPGARRGLNRVMGRHYKDHGTSTEKMLDKMRMILRHAHYVGEHQLEVWPEHWSKWEMREVEHTLCEFDKFERVRLGQGKPRGVYR